MPSGSSSTPAKLCHFPVHFLTGYIRQCVSELPVVVLDVLKDWVVFDTHKTSYSRRLFTRSSQLMKYCALSPLSPSNYEQLLFVKGTSKTNARAATRRQKFALVERLEACEGNPTQRALTGRALTTQTKEYASNRKHRKYDKSFKDSRVWQQSTRLICHCFPAPPLFVLFLSNSLRTMNLSLQ